MGVGVGGIKMKRNGNGSTLMEVLRGKLFLDYQISDRFHIGQGVIYSIVYSEDDITGRRISFFIKYGR